MNIIYCPGLTRKTYSNVILLYGSYLVNYNLARWFLILEHNSKNLSTVPNDAKLIVHADNKQKMDYVMACYTAI